MNALIAPPPIWPGPEDVEGTHRDRGQAELGVVGVRHVLARELRHRVRPPRLADRADGRHVALLDVERVLAEHLARRELDEALERVARRDGRLERVVGADHVHPHRAHRAREHGVDARDPGGVDDVGASRGELGEPVEIEDVPLDEAEVGMPDELGARERVAVQVVDSNHLVRGHELLRERRPDEAGAARDQDALTRQWHARIVDAGRHAGRDRRGAVDRRVVGATSRMRRSRSAAPSRCSPGRVPRGARDDGAPITYARTRRVPRAGPLDASLRPGRGNASAAGGRVPRAGAARLARVQPAAPDAACAELYGGPQAALVGGRVGGRRVWARLTRIDGCQIGRWGGVSSLLPPGGAR